MLEISSFVHLIYDKDTEPSSINKIELKKFQIKLSLSKTIRIMLFSLLIELIQKAFTQKYDIIFILPKLFYNAL